MHLFLRKALPVPAQGGVHSGTDHETPHELTVMYQVLVKLLQMALFTLSSVGVFIVEQYADEYVEPLIFSMVRVTDGF